MPHLAFALISVLAHVAAQEARITDLVKAEYTDEGCEAAGWGPFPNATVATSTSLTAEAYSKAHGTSGCKCGMLYGLAHSSLSREDDVAAMSSAVQGPALPGRRQQRLRGRLVGLPVFQVGAARRL